MTHLSLFSGIGGLDLAAEWAGFTSILQVEKDEDCLKVLNKHWPNVPKIKDIKNVTKESTKIRPTVISGGFPCQPFSQYGKKQGDRDDRYLWPEMLRVIQEFQPAWVVGENVAGILNLGIETMLIDLERENYQVQIFNIPACSVGAFHQRSRIWIIAHLESGGRLAPEIFPEAISESEIKKPNEWDEFWFIHYRTNEIVFCEESKSILYDDDDGISPWMARCLGNAVVPQQAYPIFKGIALIEEGDTNERYI